MTGMSTPTRYVVIDLEATGLDPECERIVSLAVVYLDATGTPTREPRVELVNPGRPIPAEATAVHGITDADVADAPSFAAFADPLSRLVASRVAVAHNWRYDGTLLACEAERHGVRFAPAASACTLRLSQTLDPTLPSHTLEYLAERYGLPHSPHDAASDALATAALLRMFLARGIVPERHPTDHRPALRHQALQDHTPATPQSLEWLLGRARRAGFTSKEGFITFAQDVLSRTDDAPLTRAEVQRLADALEANASTARAAA